MSGDYSIGSQHWPGLSKLVEESGEVAQIVGKLIGAGGEREHFSGVDLFEHLEEELADLLAGIVFVIQHNDVLRPSVIDARYDEKLAQFNTWHEVNA